jgi:predicted house-cleaning NTP pyrophosphatase (Maf/HAM1 superfamily)
MLFVKTPFREKILEKFKNDFSVMKMFFDELMKKVEAYISSI